MRKQVYALIAALILIVQQTANAQVYQQWVALVDGLGFGNEAAQSIAVDAAGNVYVVGYVEGSGVGPDYATIKFDSSGVKQWAAIYDGPAHTYDEASAIAVDANGNVIVTGSSVGHDTGYDYATIKYDPNGVELWVARYDGPPFSDDHAAAMALDAAGNIYVTGTSNSEWETSPPLESDCVTIKYNPSGAEQWVARYDSAGRWSESASAIAVSADGYVFIAGSSQKEETGQDFITIKYNASSGLEQWAARYNGSADDDDYANALTVDDAGNVYVTGQSAIGSGNWDYATLKYDANGTWLWVATYDGPGHELDAANDLAMDLEGNVYVTGRSEGIWTQSDFATIKYDSDGEEQWVARYDGPANWYDGATSVALDAEGNAYVTGSSNGIGTEYDYATIKYDPNGSEQWVARYNSPEIYFDAPAALEVNLEGNVYVTGSGGTIKYTQSYNPCVTITLTPFSAPIQIPATGGSFAYYLVATNYSPNPRPAQIWIELILPMWSGHNLLLGPADVNLNPGATGWYRTQIVPASAPAGLYHYVAHSGIYPYLAWECDTLEFVKLTAGDGPLVADWGDWNEGFGVSDVEHASGDFSLAHAFPNPFNPSTALSFQLSAFSQVSLRVYDTAGRLVATLVDGWRNAGLHEATFDGSGLPSGIYLVRLQAGDFTAAQKLVLMK